MMTIAVADEVLRYLYVASLRPLATLGVVLVVAGVAVAACWYERRALGWLRRGVDAAAARPAAAGRGQ